MSPKTLPLTDLRRKPLRTAVLMIIAAFMSAALFGGAVAGASLRNGLESLEQRLGADIIVVPENAGNKHELENILLQGTPGYFYMDKSVQDRLAATEGIERLSPQYFLVSANAECCTVQVQIIGFDDTTDFTVKPWLEQSFKGRLGENEIIIGSALSTSVGHTLSLYGVECKAVGKLASTGTGLDTAVYTTNDTVRRLISAAEVKGISVLSKQSPDDVISSVYIKAKDGTDIDELTAGINLGIEGVRAVRTKSMITGTADRIAVISGSVKIIISAVWVLAAVILLAAFSGIAAERKKEFAVLRVIGFSRKRLGRFVFCESVIVSAAGALAGGALAGAVIFPFGRLIEIKTSLPFLAPGAGQTAAYALVSLVTVVVAGSLASAHSAYRLSRVDTAKILREGN